MPALILRLLVLMILLSGNVFSQDTSKTQLFINNIFYKTLNTGATYQLLDELCTKFPLRLSGSSGAQGAVKWTKSLMEKYGFDNVFLQEVMVPHWERGDQEVARIIFSDNSKKELSVLALGGSVATGAQGVTAKVIEVQTLEEVEKLGQENINGKIVFYNGAFDQSFIETFSGYGKAVRQRSEGASQAAKFGAVAVVIRSVGTAHDDIPHTGSLSYKPDSLKIPAAALGVLSAELLSNELKNNPELKLFLKMNCRTLPEALSYNVVGEIKGSVFPEKIILVGGHLDAWDVGHGAHDDGAGVMQSISTAKTLMDLGYKPRHTLRVVMFMNEENGLRGGKKYAELAVKNNENHLLAIETDAGGFTPRGFTFEGPDSTLFIMQNWLKYFPDMTISFFSKGGGGADIGPLNKANGTPIVGLRPDPQRYFDFHHSPADVFSAVNRRELELGTASLATLIFLVDQYGL